MALHPLAGVISKLRRADEHLVVLYNEIRRYMNDSPYGLAGHRDTGDGKPGFTFHFTKQPPLYLSVIIGDIVHNLRGSLDYIAHELTVNNGAVPTRQTQFPISLSQDDFINQAISLKKLNTVSPKALKVVSAFQPYRLDEDKRTLHFLWQLAKLSNMDKHHTLALSAFAAEARTVFTHPDGRTFVSEFKDGLVYDGAVIASMSADFFDEKIKTHLRIVGKIAFRDAPLTNHEVVGVLQNTREFIGELIVPAVEPFFDPLPGELRLTSHGLPASMFSPAGSALKNM